MTGEIPTLSRAELEALQLERLRDTLHTAYTQVPHYTRAFDEAGVRPDDLTALADLARFPFTTKADLRENYPFGMFAVPREQVSRVHASSGTTGKPTVVGYTREDLDTWAELMARSIRAAGGRPGRRRARRLRLRAVHRRARAPTTARSGSAARWCRSAAG